jgi:hypothetical protein
MTARIHSREVWICTKFERKEIENGEINDVKGNNANK